MGELSVWHWLLVGAVAMMLFGANRLPDVARSVGRSLRIFKAEMRGIQHDGGTYVVDGAVEPGNGPVGADPGGPFGVAGAGPPSAPAGPAGAGVAGPAGAGAAGAPAAGGVDGSSPEGGPRRPGAQ